MAKTDKESEAAQAAAQAAEDDAAAAKAQEAADKEAADKAALEDGPKLTKAEESQQAHIRRAEKRAALAKEKTDELNASLEEAGKDSFRVACTTKVVSSMVEPNSGTRIPAAGQGDVVMAGPLKEGSWLEAQIAAGLLVIVE